MTDKNIFITGATGFIGNKLALKLAEKNRVFALVRPESNKKTYQLREKGIEIIYGDLLESNSYSEKLNSIDYIFHLAALFKLDASKKELYNHNVLGTKRLLEACLNKDIKKIIYFSTAYVAGAKEKDFITEDEPYPKRFKNWYEWSKAEGEKVVLDFCKRYDLSIVIVRPAIVYGPGSAYGFYSALSLISKGKLWILPGNGRNKVHLVYVDDVVNASIHSAWMENNSGQIYHICDSFPHQCREIIGVICEHLGRKTPSIAIPRSLAHLISRSSIWKLLFKELNPELLDYFLYNQTFTNTKLKATGFHLIYPSPIEGINSTINWYLENRILTKP